MLDSKQRAHLKALAHPRKPVVLVGKKGLSDNLIKEALGALLAHELIKVQFQESALEEMESICQQLALDLDAEIVETRGHVVTFYKSHPENPRISLK